MLKALIKVRLTALRVWLGGGGRIKKTRSKTAIVLFSLLMLYSLAALGFLFWYVFDLIVLPFHAAELDWLFFSSAGICAFAIMFIGSVFFAKAQLFEARDNDLLLSMPIKPGYILLSRMVMLFVINLFFELPVAVSALSVSVRAGIFRSFGPAAFIVLFLLLPFFSLAFSALFGWFLSVVTARIKHKSIIGTLLCVVFLAAYSYLMAKLNTAVTDFASSAGKIADHLGPIAPVYWFGSAIASGSIPHFLYSVFLFAGTFIAAYLILSVSFLRLTTVNHGFVKEPYKEKHFRVRAADSALLGREFSRLTSSSGYMVNAGLGVLMELAAAVIMFIKRTEVIALVSEPSFAPFVVPVVVIMLCLLTSMNFFSAPSVSLEGNNIWIVKSLPVSEIQILSAKLKMHLYISIPPMLFLQTVCVFLIKPDPVPALTIYLLPLGFTFFTAILGLVENLRHPNLDWINETQAVKSGFGLLFTMLISWGILVLSVLLYLYCKLNFVSLALLFLSFICTCTFFLCRWAVHTGSQIFNTL